MTERDEKLKEILKDIKDLGAYEVEPYGIENHLSIDGALSQINQLFSEEKDKEVEEAIEVVKSTIAQSKEGFLGISPFRINAL